MLLAKMVSLRSGCNSRPAGAVIVRNNRILATGYNGPMPGAWHCTDRGPNYCFRREKGIPDIDKYNFCRATHAEANAIAQAARFGISVEGADLYCTLAPCYVCLKLIASAGIKAVYYEYDYGSRDFERDTFWQEAIKEAGLREFRQVRVSEEVLKQLVEEILPYPTSRRRLVPTDFLEEFQDGKTYGLPTVEVLLNKLRYQPRPELRGVRFVIENPSTTEPKPGKLYWSGPSQPEEALSFLEEQLSKDGQLEVVLEIEGSSWPVTFIREAENFRLLAKDLELDEKDFSSFLLLADFLAYRLSKRLALPFKLDFHLKSLSLHQEAA